MEWTLDTRIEVTNKGRAALQSPREPEPLPKPKPRFFPTSCVVCHLANIYGQMTCSDTDCPGKADH